MTLALEHDLSEGGNGLYSPVSITAQILELPVDERLKCMEALWGSLRHTEVDSPAWHGLILGDRRAEVDAGEASFITSTELKARLAKD